MPARQPRRCPGTLAVLLLALSMTAGCATPPAPPVRPPAPAEHWQPVWLKRLGISLQRPADFLPDGRSGPRGGRRAWSHPERAVILGVVQYRRPGVDGAAETARFLTGLLPDARLADPQTERIHGIEFLTRAAAGADGWVRVAFTRQQDENLLAYTVVARTGFPARDQASRAIAERFLHSFAPAPSGPRGQVAHPVVADRAGR